MKKTEPFSQRIPNGNIAQSVLRLAVPNMIALLAVAAYSLADSYFVAELEQEAVAAIGIVFPFHVSVQAIGYTLGMGAGSLLSRALGRRDMRQADQAVFVACSAAVLCGLIITGTGLLFCDPLLRVLGATDGILPYARAYVTPLLYSAPAMCTAFVVSQLLRAEGKAMDSMVGLTVGSTLNILLDPLFIFSFRLGISGAATATLVSQWTSACLLLSAYPFHRSRLHPFRNARLYDFKEIGNILIAGMPSFFRQGLSGLATVLLNRAAAAHSDAAVGAMSLVSRLFLLLFSVCLGIGQGMMPVVGYHHGAGHPKQMRTAYLFAMGAATASMLFIGIPLFFFAPQLLSLFRSDEELLRIGIVALRAQSVVLFTHGLVTCTILFLQAIGNPFCGTLLASARQGLFFLPLIFWLPQRFGILGVELAQPTADLCTFLFALPFSAFGLRICKKQRCTPYTPSRSDTP